MLVKTLGSEVRVVLVKICKPTVVQGQGRSLVLGLTGSVVATGSSPAGTVTLTTAAVQPEYTTDRRWAEQVELPAGIVELDGLTVSSTKLEDVYLGLVGDDT